MEYKDGIQNPRPTPPSSGRGAPDPETELNSPNTFDIKTSPCDFSILSLFDGMSCGQLALSKLGIKSYKYYSSEIDKYAIKVTQENFPKTEQLGDIKDWRSWSIPKVDLLLAGSPCQGFSFSGKGLNFDDPRSKLFFEFVDILKHYKPKYWLLENVCMKKEFENVISTHLNMNPIMINSSLVSAQNRKRLYWTNIKAEVIDFFGRMQSQIKVPEDKGIVLSDIIEDGFVDRSKSHCICSNEQKGGNLKEYYKKSRRQVVFCGRQTGRHIVDGKRKDFKGAPTKQRFELRADEKTNCLTSVEKDNIIFIKQKARGYNKGNYFYKKSPTLTSNSWEDNNHIYKGLKYRKLTPLECERLQTVPDNYTSCVSNSQRYKMLGNGWTVDVIAHILEKIEVLNG